MVKKTKQDIVIEKLDIINKNIINNNDISKSLITLLNNKRIEVNQKRAISTTLFIAGYCSLLLLIILGISRYYNWNHYISTGVIGIILLFMLHLIYMGNV